MTSNKFLGLLEPADRCCCCLNLKLGNQILIILHMLAAVSSVVTFFTTTIHSDIVTIILQAAFLAIFGVLLYFGFQGIFKNDQRGSNIYYTWMVVCYIIAMIAVLVIFLFIAFILTELGGFGAAIIFLLIGAGVLIVEGYFVWMVFSYNFYLQNGNYEKLENPDAAVKIAA
mmetsp:Transcript_21190/g.23985  ORF Transcript_21190/g.23985 Transcript_21190/m.23985 type:complete len:171 (+) Transcript_21190:67-579(+)